MPLDTHELAWAAGFFDGEGSIYVVKRTPRNRRHTPSVSLTIGQRDPRPLARFQTAVGLGKVYGPYGPYASTFGKETHLFQVIGFEKVQAIVALLWCYLSPPKRAQARSVLQRLEEELASWP